LGGGDGAVSGSGCPTRRALYTARTRRSSGDTTGTSTVPGAHVPFETGIRAAFFASRQRFGLQRDGTVGTFATGQVLTNVRKRIHGTEPENESSFGFILRFARCRLIS
jgi:hypothetical protein